uniref:Uncharacterized protein n=1 Tax=Arundo donax TaxID=35708 RepID=A0A0A9EWW9_ARUDO
MKRLIGSPLLVLSSEINLFQMNFWRSSMTEVSTSCTEEHGAGGVQEQEFFKPAFVIVDVSYCFITSCKAATHFRKPLMLIPLEYIYALSKPVQVDV